MMEESCRCERLLGGDERDLTLRCPDDVLALDGRGRVQGRQLSGELGHEATVKVDHPEKALEREL